MLVFKTQNGSHETHKWNVFNRIGVSFYINKLASPSLGIAKRYRSVEISFWCKYQFSILIHSHPLIIKEFVRGQ